MDQQRLEETLATVHVLLEAEGADAVAALVRQYPARLEQTGYDNWNGGTEVWTIYIEVPARELARIGPKPEQLEGQINAGSILAKKGVEFTRAEDLGDLTKKLTKELKLVPEGIAEEVKGADNIRLILRNLTQLTNNPAQLRGLYRTGHGRDGQYRGLQPRHARLAVASAVAFIDFVSETYREREERKGK